jgi:hypothetical protein
MRRERLPGDAASFRREWNVAFGLVAAAAALLFAAGRTVAGAIAIGLGAVALVARWSAMRKANRGFYGQDKRPG